MSVSEVLYFPSWRSYTLLAGKSGEAALGPFLPLHTPKLYCLYGSILFKFFMCLIISTKLQLFLKAETLITTSYCSELCPQCLAHSGCAY